MPPGVTDIGDRVRSELDDWLPDFSIRVAHRQPSTAPADAVWEEASALGLGESPVLGRLVRWRIPGLRPDLRFSELFREPPFVVLAEHEHGLVSGLAGRIWTLRRDYPQFPEPEAFRRHAKRGTARVVIANWCETEADGTGTFASEARVQAIGAQGRLGLAAIRPLVATFENLIGTETLRAAVRRAERGQAPAGG